MPYILDSRYTTIYKVIMFSETVKKKILYEYLLYKIFGIKY